MAITNISDLILDGLNKYHTKLRDWVSKNFAIKSDIKNLFSDSELHTISTIEKNNIDNDLYWGNGTGMKIGDKFYNVVEMPDGNIWMAENLELETTNSMFYMFDEASYGRNEKNYGRLYSWDDAMSISVPGWHLPSKAEWETLASAVGGASSAGTVLKSKDSWTSGSGTDDYGFCVLASGFSSWVGSSEGFSEGDLARFWTSSNAGGDGPFCAYFNANNTSMGFTDTFSIYGLSVRLVKDKD